MLDADAVTVEMRVEVSEVPSLDGSEEVPDGTDEAGVAAVDVDAPVVAEEVVVDDETADVVVERLIVLLLLGTAGAEAELVVVIGRILALSASRELADKIAAEELVTAETGVSCRPWRSGSDIAPLPGSRMS